MSETTRRELKEEGIKALQNYLACGLEGFKQQGIDRLEAIGIDTSRCRANRQEIEHLIRHVIAYA